MGHLEDWRRYRFRCQRRSGQNCRLPKWRLVGTKWSNFRERKNQMWRVPSILGIWVQLALQLGWQPARTLRTCTATRGHLGKRTRMSVQLFERTDAESWM